MVKGDFLLNTNVKLVHMGIEFKARVMQFLRSTLKLWAKVLLKYGFKDHLCSLNPDLRSTLAHSFKVDLKSCITRALVYVAS